MEINRIAVYGLGLIGGSIAKAIKQSAAAIEIYAFDDDDDILNDALSERIINDKITDPEKIDSFDVIFLCLPMEVSFEMFGRIAPKLTGGQILTDVCGVKSIFKKAWDNFRTRGNYIGGHPMTGKEKGGYKNSDPLLFENSIYVLTEDLEADAELVKFRKLIELLGANILYIPAHQHDVIAASVSHLPQLLSVALVNTASLKTDNFNFLDLAAGGFRDMTRIASSDFNIWESVIKHNKKEILAAFDSFNSEMKDTRKLIEEDNLQLLKQKFDDARFKRDEVPQNTKGFLKPLMDLFVFVKDEPGAISKISTALYEENVNIKDMELLKIREGSGGTFRLSFDSIEDVNRAAEIMKQIGFITER